MAKNKYTDIDENPSQDKWKKRYLASLEELEKEEVKWRDSEKNLRALIIHLTDASDTSSEKLNKQLSVLRDAIKKGVEANKLKKAIDEVADSILGLHAIRRKNKNLQIEQFGSLVNKIKPAGKIEKKLAKISKQISNAENIKQISPYIDELAKLLVYGLSLAEKKKDKGFISSLLDKKKEESEVETVVEKTTEVVEVKTELNLENAVNSLVKLLDKMILPGDLQIEANLIKRELDKENNENIFIKSLEQTVSITADILDRVKKEKKEIEDFLKQLTGRLQELDRDIKETARIRELTHQHGLDMTDVMKTEMNTMEDGINNINNLDELKTAIQSRVILLRNHVDNFLLNEGEKNQEAVSIIKELKDQVKEMEQETEDLKQQIEEERKQTLRDVLTEIPNRLAYNERLEYDIANFQRNKTPFVLVVWDIDFFKKVNDVYGHAAGDQVLKLVASILNKNMRQTDFIARYGGEEFVSLLPDTDINGAQLITDKLREIIAESNFHFREESVHISVSAGFAQIKQGETGEALFIRADEALYKAKENGRNNCQAAR